MPDVGARPERHPNFCTEITGGGRARIPAWKRSATAPRPPVARLLGRPQTASPGRGGFLAVALAAAALTSAGTAMGAATDLPLRSDLTQCISNSNTTQTISSSFGASLFTSGTFSTTSSFDFYSAPLTANQVFASGDKG